MAAKRKANKTDNADGSLRTKMVAQKYHDRLSVLRKAKEFSVKDDIPKAVTAYHKYLEALAFYFEIEERQLRPELFTKNNNLAEILLISQVYWDLARAYDRNQKLKKECDRCLDQFVKFSLGFKFQFINSEMLRKYIKKKACYNTPSFEAAYVKIRVQSKQCYIATYAFGETHPVTEDLRIFRNKILKYQIGHTFVDYYYRLSPNLVNFMYKHPTFGHYAKIVLKPAIIIFSKLWRSLIIF
jgi:hypothetical protein